MSGPSSSIVLTFHGIGRPNRALDAGEDRYWLDRSTFLNILDTVSLYPDVEITFDDGNASDLEHAVPALLDRHMTATFFVLTGRLGDPGMLDDEGVQELVRQGMRIGSHGMAHRPWRGMDPDVAMTEIFTAKDALEALAGVQVTVASCPFGSYDRASIRRACLAGYDALFTSDGGRVWPGQWLRPRNTIDAAATPASLRRLLDAPDFSLPSLLRRAKTAIKSRR